MEIRNNLITKAGAAVLSLGDITEVRHKEECTTSNNHQWDTTGTSVDTGLRGQEVAFAPDCWERWRVAAVSTC